MSEPTENGAAAFPGSRISVDVQQALEAVFEHLQIERSLLYRRNAGWACDKKPLDGLAEVGANLAGYRHAGDSNSVALFEHKGTLGTVSHYDGRLGLNVAAGNPTALGEAWEEVAPKFPLATSATPDEVSVNFWTLGRHGPSTVTRKITVPSWDEVEANYPAAVADALRRMMSGSPKDDAVSGFAPGAGGQLLLWHGPPGTGKTYALRALAREWQDWCSLHYIADPETFFGAEANYMMQVLLHDDDGIDDIFDDDDDAVDKDKQQRWRLLVLEDTGELLRKDAKEVVGQALSRLLNVVDGLIGQGLRILVLVTTNEEVGKLHPAVARSGRCAMQLEFAALPTEEAADWLRANGREDLVDQLPGGRVQLADLYAMVTGQLDKPERALVGFGAA